MVLERNYLIPPPAFGFSEVSCRLKGQLHSTAAVTHLALKQATSPEAIKDEVWEQLMKEAGKELIHYLVQQGEGADPLQDGVLVTVQRSYYDDAVMQCRKFVLKAQLWKVVI